MTATDNHDLTRHNSPSAESLERRLESLRQQRQRIFQELRAYPPQVAGCDLHYQDLIARRDAVIAAIKALENHTPQGHNDPASARNH
jgi:hypothetical protein